MKKTLKNNWKQIISDLKSIAAEKGITQEEIAEKTGLIQSNISRLFSLKYCPTLNTLALICDAVGVEIKIK